MSDLEFIQIMQQFRSVGQICKDNNINYSNLVYGRTTEENEKLIAKELKKEVIKFYDIVLLSLIKEE